MSKAAFMFGNVCAKHPELLGKRIHKHECVGCRKASSLARYAKHKELMIAAAKANYSKNRDAIVAKRKSIRAERSERLRPEKEEKARIRHEAALKKAAEYHKGYMPKWIARNLVSVREKGAIRTRQWRNANSQLVKYRANLPDAQAYRSARRSASRLATPAWANAFFIAEAYRLAKLREKVCGGKWHVDHIVPLKSKYVCGLHCEANLQVIPAKANSSKGNRHWPDMPLLFSL